MNTKTKLHEIDWDFKNSETNSLTHSFHPYPAKFIPQIPRNIIDLLSDVGDKILDPFCGSGTSLVEAILLDRNAVGVDINPLSSLIAKVKATPIPEIKLRELNQILSKIGEDAANFFIASFEYEIMSAKFNQVIPTFPKLRFWFKDFVIIEAALIKHHILMASDEDIRDLLMVTFSSILVTISKQDSDTRYTRREKNIKEGDTIRLFIRKAKEMANKMIAFSLIAPSRRPEIITADAQDVGSYIEPNSVDLVVTSPPYPNAYSYHLYHRNRMFWLDMDPYPVKKQEIGSHRKYSAKNGATPETFKSEMKNCFGGLYRALKPNSYCCVVIGDSVVKGKLIKNNEIITHVAETIGFKTIDDIKRTIQVTKKSFNPKIGKIKNESILVFRK